MPVDSLRALLAHSIDYAGMFPPCNLGLEPALKNQAEYVRSPDAWMLGAFILSVEQFDAAKQLLSQFDAQHPLRFAALGPKTANTDAFPTSMQIAKAMVTPSTHQLPIKFTAGLHHPLRQYREEVQTKMHGFLNVLGAAALAAEHRWDTNQTAMMLEDENVDSFSFTDDFFAWREWRIDTKRLQYRRRFVVSFGSC